MSARACKSCVWYRPIDGDTAVGTCHRLAPAPDTIEPADNHARIAVWPMVDWDDFCGEWSLAVYVGGMEVSE